MGKQVDLLQGTLDMLILESGLTRRSAWLRRPAPAAATHRRPAADPARVTVSGLVPPRAQRADRLRVGERENNRKAKFYTLTASGRKQLRAETALWNDFSSVVAGVLSAVPGES